MGKCSTLCLPAGDEALKYMVDLCPVLRWIRTRLSTHRKVARFDYGEPQDWVTATTTDLTRLDLRISFGKRSKEEFVSAH